MSSIQLLSLYPFIQFLTCTRIPCRDSHCENGSFEVLSVHVQRMVGLLQTTQAQQCHVFSGPLADRRMSSTEAAFPGEQLMQLAGFSPLWGSGCAPKDCCGFPGLRNTGDIWNLQQHQCHESRTGWHWLHGPIGASSCLH